MIMNRNIFSISLIVSFLLWTGICSSQISALTPSLTFGKEFSVRSSIPLNPSMPGPGATVITSPAAPIQWEQPTVGSLYAAVSVGSISAGQLLTGDAIKAYGYQTSVLYEAPNHPYVIQSLMQGGTVSIGGKILGTKNDKSWCSIEYGRIKPGISAEGGVLRAGQPATIIFTVPDAFIGGEIRIDFGGSVLANGGAMRALPPTKLASNTYAVAVTLPVDYQSESWYVEAIATNAAFLNRSAGASGPGVQANGATVSNRASFKVIRPEDEGRLLVSLTVDRSAVRKNGTATYSYAVTNNTGADLTDVEVWDAHSGTVAQRVALQRGARFDPTSSPEFKETIKNHAIVTAHDAFGKTYNAQSNEVEVKVIDPAIRVTVWLDPGRAVKAGIQATFKYKVENTGDVDLGPVTLRDETDNYTFPVIQTLEAGKEEIRSRTVEIKSDQTVRQASANAGVPLDARGGNVTATDDENIQILVPDFTISIAADQTIVRKNTKIQYTLTLANTSGADFANVSAKCANFQQVSLLSAIPPEASMSYYPDEVVTETVTRVFEVSGMDSWGATVRHSASVTVTVIAPKIDVSVTANGQSMKAKVNKDDAVRFVYTVLNDGDCDLTDVRVEGDGGASYSETIPLLQKMTSKTIRLPDWKADNDATHKVNVSATDPLQGSVSSSDLVNVEVSQGLVAELQNMLGNIKRLVADIELYLQKFEKLYTDFSGLIAEDQSKNADPCADGRIQSLLREAATYPELIKGKLNEIEKLLRDPLVAKASGAETMDVINAVTKLADSDKPMKTKLKSMTDTWEKLGCGTVPVKKNNSVNAVITVVDQNGQPLQNAIVICRNKANSTAANGAATFSLSLNKDDNVTANATYTAQDGGVSRGSNSGTHDGSDQFLLTITLNVSVAKGVTLTGKVLDGKGNPIPGATVSVPGVQETTDAEGAYSLEINATKGSTLTVNAVVKTKTGSKSSGSASVVFQGEDALSVPAIVIADVEMPQTFSITGDVFDARGAGLAGVTISAGGLSVDTKGNGSYEIGTFTGTSGDVISITASITDAGGKTNTQSASITYQGGAIVRAGTIVFGNLASTIRMNITGTVVDAKGVPIENATVEANGLSVTTDGNGAFSGLGPIEVQANTDVSVTAFIQRTDGGTARGASKVSLQQSGTATTTITISDAVVRQSFTITGNVVDSKGAPIVGAIVTAGAWSGTTDGDGAFTSDAFSDPVGTSYTVSAKAMLLDGSSVGGSARVVYSGGKSLYAGTISIATASSLNPNKIVAGLTLSPLNPVIKAGESVSFTATVQYDDNTTADVTASAQWSTQSNSFSSMTPGKYPVTATAGGRQATTEVSVACPEGKDWDAALRKCIDLKSAVDDTKNGLSNLGLCNGFDLVSELSLLTISLGTQFISMVLDLEEKHDEFMKLANDQKSNICKNPLAASTYAACNTLSEELKDWRLRIEKKAADVLYRVGICMEGKLSDNASDQIIEFLKMIGSYNGQAKDMIAEMNARFTAAGCDQHEVTQLGNTISDNSRNPFVTADGGNGAVEKNGNIYIDVIETGAMLGFPEGASFDLAISGRGDLGSTPPGGERMYVLSLAPGTYVATLTTMLAPKNPAAYTIIVTVVWDSSHIEMIANKSGYLAQGASTNISFTVESRHK